MNDKEHEREVSESTSSNESDFQVADRRFWVVDNDAVDQATPHREKLPTYVEELQERTALAERKLQEKLKELEAANEAFRARLSQQTERRVAKEKELLATSFLEVHDNLERALQASAQSENLDELRRGVELTLKVFGQCLRSEGIEELRVLDQPFDPRDCEAIGVKPVEDPDQDQKVVEVLRKGYRSGENLLRPARVRVGKYEG